MNKTYLYIGAVAAAGVAGIMIMKKRASQIDGTSNSVDPKTTKITKSDKLSFNLSENKLGTNDRVILSTLARIDPNKGVSPDGRVWEIKYAPKQNKHKPYVAGGNRFTTRAKAKQWIASQG